MTQANEIEEIKEEARNYLIDKAITPKQASKLYDAHLNLPEDIWFALNNVIDKLLAKSQERIKYLEREDKIMGQAVREMNWDISQLKSKLAKKEKEIEVLTTWKIGILDYVKQAQRER